MRIDPNNINNYLAKSTGTRNFVTKLGKTGAILPVILLEATVTGGRTYQAYKRDGFVEARERVTEESLGAVFWLFGATMFGKLIETIGNKTLKLPKEHCDVGQDALRKPVNNMFLDNPHYNKELFSKFKFGKIIASLVAACTFIGYVVPKMNQALTKKFYTNRIEPEKKLDPKMKKLYEHIHGKEININSVQNFKSAVSFKNSNSGAKNKDAALSFKSAEFFTRMAQNFEQNAIYKLLGTDVGTVSGRTLNARNDDERVEIMFRDISSIYFYCFSTGAILNFLNNHDVFKGANTKLDPETAKEVHNDLLKLMKDKKQSSEMNVNAFKEFMLGKEKDEKLYKKVFPELPPKEPKKYLFGLIKTQPSKEYRTIKLDDFKNILKANVSDNKLLNTYIERAQRMSGLQPEISVANDKKVETYRILSESQVEDILRGGEARDADFMYKHLNNRFKTKENPRALSNKYTFIPQGEIETLRKNILGYVESIITDAKNNGKDIVDWESMQKVNKRNLNRNGLYWGAGMAVSALFLSTIIPKIQYFITKMRTGKDGFPGIENMRTENQDSKKA